MSSEDLDRRLLAFGDMIVSFVMFVPLTMVVACIGGLAAQWKATKRVVAA